MSTDLENYRKRLKFRSWHRGTQEADLLLGSFADANLDSMQEEELSLFEELLNVPDPVLTAWMTGTATPPEDVKNPVLDALLAFEYKPTKR